MLVCTSALCGFPFLYCRSFRPTATFITPSAAYGLALNIAGIESRLDDGKAAMTITSPDLPRVKIAFGALYFPQVQSLYQQAHN
jgi:CRISPR-associated protein Cas5t